MCSAVIHVVHDFVGFTTPTTASPGPTRANIRDATRCPPQIFELSVFPSVLVDQLGARLHCSKRIFVMQATEDRLHKDERPPPSDDGFLAPG